MYERKFSANAGLFDWDGLYESTDSRYSNRSNLSHHSNDIQVCWNYALLEGNTVGDGGEHFDVVSTSPICSAVHGVCDNEDDIGDGLDMEGDTHTVCGGSTVDLVLVLDVTMSDTVWQQLSEYLSKLIVDINRVLEEKEESYSNEVGFGVEVLFRVTLITFWEEMFDVEHSLQSYTWGNHKVLMDNVLNRIRGMVPKDASRSSGGGGQLSQFVKMILYIILILSTYPECPRTVE